MKRIFMLLSLALLLCACSNEKPVLKEPEEVAKRLEEKDYQTEIRESTDSEDVFILKKGLYSFQFRVSAVYVDDSLWFYDFYDSETGNGSFMQDVNSPKLSHLTKEEIAENKKQEEGFRKWLSEMEFTEDDLVGYFDNYYRENKK